MPPVGGKLGERFQDEAALAHSRMRNLQLLRSDDEVSEQENIDVDGARAFRYSALATHSQFDGLKAREQEPGEKLRLHFHHEVQKPGLIMEILRLRLIDRRPAEDVNACGFEPLQRREQVRLAVTEIGTEGKKSLFQNTIQNSEF